MSKAMQRPYGAIDDVPYRQASFLDAKSACFKARYINQIIDQLAQMVALHIYDAQEFPLCMGVRHLALQHQLTKALN